MPNPVVNIHCEDYYLVWHFDRKEFLFEKPIGMGEVCWSWTPSRRQAYQFDTLDEAAKTMSPYPKASVVHVRYSEEVVLYGS